MSITDIAELCGVGESSIVERLIRAERILFFGVGSSLMTERDAAEIISNSGSAVDSIEAAKKVKERGATVISVTRFEKSPLTSFSDITLLCGANEGPLQSGSLSRASATPRSRAFITCYFDSPFRYR